MYKDFFGLQDQPFRNTPDPEFFYFSAQHRQGLTAVISGIQSRCPLVLLLGEVGTGKTTICYYIQKQEGYLCGHLKNPFLTELEFLETVNRELGIPVSDHSRKALTDDLRDHLVRQHRGGKLVVLIVDEAHRLPLPVLDQIQTLSNLQESDAQLLQIVLVGQPELLDTLCHPRLRSLNQRAGTRYRLRSMDRTDTVNYINYRLEKAGCANPSFLTRKALATIWQASGGTPRLINQLCDRVLSEAYQQGKKRVGRRLVRTVVEDPVYQPLFAPRGRDRFIRPAMAGLGLVVCISVYFGLWYFGFGPEFKAALTRKTGLATGEGRAPIEKRESIAELPGERGHEREVPALVEQISKEPVKIRVKKIAAEPNLRTLQTKIEEKPAERGLEQPQERELVVPVAQSLAAHAAPVAKPVAKRRTARSQKSADTVFPDLKLSAIAWDGDGGKSIAVLNDHVLREGDFLGKAKVLNINPDHIVLLHENEHLIKRINPQEDVSRSAESDLMVGDEERLGPVIQEPDGKNDTDTDQGPPPDSNRTILYFYKNSSMLPETYEALDRLAAIVEQNPNHEVVIRGYTDNAGSADYNTRLSESRAQTVRQYFLEKGIDPVRIWAVGMGEKDPLKPNTTEENRAANRRVEVVLIPGKGNL